jgi:hypothetical protein
MGPYRLTDVPRASRSNDPDPVVGHVSSDAPEGFVLPRLDRSRPAAPKGREGMPSMVPRTAATGAPHPDAIEFVRFCYHRRRVGWPELYDEMCAVAGRGLFRGFSSDDLGGIGVGFSLFDMPALANLASRVVAEEVALRRPVTVVLMQPAGAAAPEPDAGPTQEDSALSGPMSKPTRATRAPTPLVTAASRASGPPSHAAATATDERTFDVPIRLALAPSGA